MKDGDESTRGYIGVSVNSISSVLANYYGLENGENVKDAHNLSSIIAGTQSGKIVEIKALRNGMRKSFNLEIDRKSEEKSSSGIVKEINRTVI